MRYQRRSVIKTLLGGVMAASIALPACGQLMLQLHSGGVGGGGGDAENSIAFTNKTGSTQTNYPVSLARPFAEGEIANAPKVVRNGTPVTTQATVLCRWPGGTVQHAHFAFLEPSLTNDAVATLTFENQSATPQTAMTKAEMLAFDVGCVVEITDGMVTDSVSLRDMITADAYEVVYPGQIAQTILVRDHITRTYDIGLDADDVIHVWFRVTFWAGINKVHVKVVAENPWPDVMKDQLYDVEVTGGNASPAVVFSQADIPHFQGATWMQEFWIGGTPNEQVNIDHNRAYLASTFSFLTLQSEITTSAATCDVLYDLSDLDIGEIGFFMRDQQEVGDRAEIAPYMALNAAWLHSAGNWKMRKMSRVYADRYGIYPVSFRENRAGIDFDEAGLVDAQGKWISVFGRPTMGYNSSTFLYSATVSGEELTFHGTPLAKDGLSYRLSHTPDMYSVLYALEGDPVDLYMMQVHGTFAIFAHRSASFRGPNDGSPAGVITADDFGGDLRGSAWGFRNLLRAHRFTPDAAPEKAVLASCVVHNLSAREGIAHITSTPRNGNAIWTHWYNFVGDDWGDNPLGFFSQVSNLGASGSTGVDDTIAATYTGFQQAFHVIVMCQAVEFDWDADALKAYSAPFIIGQATTPGYNLLRSGSYQWGVADLSYVAFTTWLEVQDTLLWALPTNDGDTHPGFYDARMYACSTFYTGFTNGQAAYEAYRDRWYDYNNWKETQWINATPAGGWLANMTGGRTLIAWAFKPRV